jgi:hypothetical protein
MDFIPLILAPPWGLGFGTGTESGISRRNNTIGMRGEERSSGSNYFAGMSSRDKDRIQVT